MKIDPYGLNPRETDALDSLDDDSDDEHRCAACGDWCDCIDGGKRGPRYCVHCQENSWE